MKHLSRSGTLRAVLRLLLSARFRGVVTRRAAPVLAGVVAAAAAALAVAAPASAARAHGDFVVRDGATLYHKGKPYRFTGMNVYNANNRRPWCWYPTDVGLLGQSLDAMRPGVQVVRAWFFQDFATTDGRRDWTAFDATVAEAKARGIRLIVTLGNQWADCDSEGFKTAAWYGSCLLYTSDAADE